MRSARHWLGWAALLVAGTSCLGGQTGQPTSATCKASAVDPNRPIDGIAPSSFIAAFDGAHGAPLVWEIPGAPAEDAITLVLGAGASPAATAECGTLHVKLKLELSTRDHGFLELQEVTLSGSTGQTQRARLYVDGERVTLSADLTRVARDVQISGTLTTDDAALPASVATFPASSETAGAGGGG